MLSAPGPGGLPSPGGGVRGSCGFLSSAIFFYIQYSVPSTHQELGEGDSGRISRLSRRQLSAWNQSNLSLLRTPLIIARARVQNRARRDARGVAADERSGSR